MTGMNGYGRDRDDGKVASLEEARRRASARAKEEQRAARVASRGGPIGARDWIVGGIVTAMALGMLVVWLAPLLRATGVTR